MVGFVMEWVHWFRRSRGSAEVHLRVEGGVDIAVDGWVRAHTYPVYLCVCRLDEIGDGWRMKVMMLKQTSRLFYFPICLYARASLLYWRKKASFDSVESLSAFQVACLPSQ